jgi:leader peptidase (prepilin peptidase)/N-methyltransferase
VTDVTAAAVSIPVGLLAGRLARRAADLDRARRTGSPATSGVGIELATACVLGAVVARFGISWDAAPYLPVVTMLVAATVTDLRDRRVPDRVVYPAMAASGTIMACASLLLDEPERLWWGAFGAALLGGTLLIVHLVRPDGLGRGDVKLAVVLGAAVGWLRPPSLDGLLLVAWTLLLASVLGLGGAVLGARRARAPGGEGRRRWSAVAVPFAPALSGATISVVLFAEVLLS